MKKIFLLLIVLLISTVVFGQNVIGKVNFGGNDGDIFNNLTFDYNDNSYIAVGESENNSFGNGDWVGVSSKGDTDAVIAKYSSNGILLWKKNFGGNGFDTFSSVILDENDNNYIAVGTSTSGSFGTGDWTGFSGKGSDDAIIVKFDRNGNVLWKENFGGSDDDSFQSITFDQVSGYYIAVGQSNYNSFGNGNWAGVSGKGNSDAIIVKYNSTGDISWKKSFGGTGNDYFSYVVHNVEGENYVVTGSSYINGGDWSGTTGKGNLDSILVMYDYDGGIVKKKSFGGAGNDYLYSVEYAAVGNSSYDSFKTGDWSGVTGKGGIDAVIVKFDINGNILWKKNFGGAGDDYFTSVEYNPDDDTYFAFGYSSSSSFGTGDWAGVSGKGGYDAIIVRFDTNGNVISKKNFGGSNDDFFYSSTYNDDESICVAVGTSSGPFGVGDWSDLTGKGDNDAIAAVFDTSSVVSVSSVIVAPTTLSLDVGDSSVLTATVLPANATDKRVAWTSGNTGVATVDGNGEVTAVGNGTTTITATTVIGAKVATCNVTVTTPVTGITVTPETLTLNVGDSSILSAVIAPATASNKNITWTSSDNNIATVSTSGKVTGKAEGVVTITATTVDGSYTDNCVVTVNAPVVVIPVTSVVVTPKTLSLNIGDTSTLGVTVLPENATNKNIVWTSSSIGIATVSANGLVTAIAKGSATITATSSNGKKATCKVTVTVPVASVSVDPTSLTLGIGTNSVLKATVLPVNAGNKKVTWTSSDTNIATVDTNGKVKAIAKGSAVITATTVDGNKTATCDVTVVTPITSVTIAPKSLSLGIGRTSTLVATVLPVTAENRTVVWTSSKPSIATVDANGLVTAIAKGNTTITATSADGKKKATCSVTVTIPVASVTVAPANLILGIGSKSVLKASVLPVNAGNKKVIWTSSDTNIATVDTNGKVTGKAKGNVVITATTVDGNKTATCNVTVITPITSVTITPKTLTLNVGGSSTLVVTVLPVIAENKTVTWTSSKPSVATVDSNGLVTAVAKGSATITATSADGKKKATCSVTVIIPVASVTVSPTNLILGVGANSVLKATVLPTNAGNKKVTWTSSDTSIATVDTNGKVKGIAKGNVTITVTTVDGNKTATCTVTVITPITSVTIVPKTLTLNVGGSSTLTVTVLPVIAENKTVTWTSSKPSVATVDVNGLVTAIAKGSATITATSADGKKKATCSVTVK